MPSPRFGERVAVFLRERYLSVDVRWLVLSAICITSLNARNLFVQNGGTVVVNILTVYSLFLPLDARFSLDAVRGALARRRDASVLDLNRPDPLREPVRTCSLVVLSGCSASRTATQRRQSVRLWSRSRPVRAPLSLTLDRAAAEGAAFGG